MKKWKPVLFFMGILLLLSILFALTLCKASKREPPHPKRQSAERKGGENTPDSGRTQVEPLTLEDMLHAFAEVIYTYDTSVRQYYEGADAYMTEAAYDRMVPPPDEGGKTEITLVSKLKTMTAYLHRKDDKNVDAIMEAWYTLSGTGDFQIRQLVKIEAVKSDRWLIKDCAVLDTMEQ